MARSKQNQPASVVLDGPTPLAIEMWSIEKPKDYPKNARKWTPKAVAKVRQSLREFGFRQPLVVDAEGVIVIGHLRRQAAREEGFTEVPVHVAADLSPSKIRQLLLMDNRSHDEAEWDLSILEEEMKELAALDIDLSLTGFDKAEFVSFLAGVGLTDPDEVLPAPEVPTSRLGDLWEMGGHRLLCGDAVKEADVARVMNGQMATLFATDPPYLVDYKGGNHPQSWSNSPDVKDKHWDDYTDPGKAAEFYAEFLRIGLAHCVERVPVYQWHADLRRTVVAEAWERCGLLLHQIIVWVKARPVLTRSHFMWQHEPCAYGWRKGKVPAKPPANEHSVWTINQIGESDGIHPTQKPVELARKPIAFHTQPGDVIYEPFSGSGTTLIAAETIERRCFGLELSPAFCDVIVTRWQNFTGSEATLEGDVRTFAEVAAERLAV